jgi:hypothetical protein
MDQQQHYVGRSKPRRFASSTTRATSSGAASAPPPRNRSPKRCPHTHRRPSGLGWRPGSSPDVFRARCFNGHNPGARASFPWLDPGRRALLQFPDDPPRDRLVQPGDFHTELLSSNPSAPARCFSPIEKSALRVELDDNNSLISWWNGLRRARRRQALAAGGGGPLRARLYGVSSVAENGNREPMPSSRCCRCENVVTGSGFSRL